MSFPPTPAPPALPVATETPLSPPAPPVPPPPTSAGQELALDLFASAEGISIAPQTTVFPPPPPPIQPAPPSGARREARQRQAASQKSGAGAKSEDHNVDLADSPSGPTGAAMTRVDPNHAVRLEPRRPEPSFTALARADQPSAWARGALYGGGIAGGALILALGFATLRPTPRRREPDVPAPAYARGRRRGG